MVDAGYHDGLLWWCVEWVRGCGVVDSGARTLARKLDISKGVQ